MTSSSGYNTSYSAIRDIHEDLNIAGAGPSEFEFLSGFSDDPYSKYPMMSWDNWMNFILFNEKYPTPLERNAILKKALIDQNKTLAKNSTANDKPITIYDVIKANPRLSKFRELIDYVGYGKVYDSGITIFAPINDQFDQTLEYPLNVAYKPVAALQTLRYHILPFIIKPWQMENRKLKLRTDLDKQPLETDWTKNQRLLINPINDTYMDSVAGSYTNGPGEPVSSRSDNWFPKISWEVPILKVIECSNGIVYIISRPLQFSDLL